MGKGESSSSIPEDVREVLEGEGGKLEAFELVVGTPTFTVITYRVDYGDWPSFETAPGVIKFSTKEHAIANSTHIQLGSSRFYREYECDTEGVADPEEARLVQMGSLSELLNESGIPSQPGYEHVPSTVTWTRPDFLMFCTSIMGQGRALGELRSQFTDYDCATMIADPSAFALQLGKDTGRQFDMEDVRLDGFDKLKQAILKLAVTKANGQLHQVGLDTTVLVSHGPVRYCDPPARIVGRFPKERRAAAVPFVKHSKFSGQREYRFVVEVIGEPKEKVFLMEVTDEIRGLTRPLHERQSWRW